MRSVEGRTTTAIYRDNKVMKHVDEALKYREIYVFGNIHLA